MTEPTVLAHVFDPTLTDPAVRPQDDFFRHVNGTWLRDHPIPADRPTDGAFHSLRDLSEAVTRQIVGDRTVNEVLTVGRAEIASEVKVLLQEMAREYSLGIEIAQVVLQDINPPESVKQAFNAVNEAQQERETLINEAKSEYNKVIPIQGIKTVGTGGYHFFDA